MKKQVLLNFIRFSATSFLCRGLTFLMAPLFVFFLTPAEFGLLSLTNSFIVIMTIVMGFGLKNTLSIEYFHHNDSEQKLLVTNLIATYLSLSLPLFVILLLSKGIINHYYFCNQSTTLIILISVTICFFTYAVEFSQQLLQYRTQISLAIRLQFVAAGSTVLFTFLFLIIFNWGVAGIIVAQLLGLVIGYGKQFTQATLRYYKTLPPAHTVFEQMPRYLKIGLPFVPGMLCNWIMASGDRWFLANYSNLHNVGIYTIADAFGSLFHIIVSNSITAVYLPHLLKQFADNKEKQLALEAKNKKIMWCSIAGAFIVVTCGYLIARPLLFWILPQAYQQAIPYIWFTFIGYIFLMGTYFASIFIQFNKKSYFLAFSIVIPALFNGALNRLLIPYFSIYGCITATISAYLLYFLITLAYNYKLVFYKNKKEIQSIGYRHSTMQPTPLSCKEHYRN